VGQGKYKKSKEMKVMSSCPDTREKKMEKIEITETVTVQEKAEKFI
jgi:hypothetical protein